jgi:2-C-methyl-D-erythritol 4-phosphate cytidylyltransferase
LIGLIVPAAGSGSRFGSDVPKQFLDFHGKRLYQHALEAFAPFVSEAVLVVPEAWDSTIREETSGISTAFHLSVITGGAQRQDSVYCGLKALSPGIGMVLIHDAVRPYVTPEVISRVIEVTRQGKACIPVLPVSETVKEVESDLVVQTLDRQSLRLVQTPQGFDKDILLEAFNRAAQEAFYGTDESVLVERMGWPVRVVPGDQRNIKITWKEDLLPSGERS